MKESLWKNLMVFIFWTVGGKVSKGREMSQKESEIVKWTVKYIDWGGDLT